jgi:ribosomal protein S18 acetylase RimI-like enzyme
LPKQKDPVEFITLEVRPSNTAALKLYLKNGGSK